MHNNMVPIIILGCSELDISLVATFWDTHADISFIAGLSPNHESIRLEEFRKKLVI